MEQKKKITLIICLLSLLIITSVIVFIYHQKNKTQNTPSKQPITTNDEKEKTRAIFEEYLAQKGDKSSVDLFTVNDSQNMIVPLDYFASAISFKISPSVDSFLDNENYSLVT